MTQQQQPVGQQYQPGSQQFGGSYGQQFEQPTGQPFGQQTQQPIGQGTQQQVAGTTGQAMQFEEGIPSELRLVLHDTNKLANVAEWTKNQLVTQGPQMQEVVRLCDDLASIAELNEKLIARDSAFGMQISQALIEVAQQALPTLQQYEQQPEVRELSGVVRNLVDSTQKELQMIGGQQTAGIGQQAGGFQQSGATSQQYGTTQQFGGQGQQY